MGIIDVLVFLVFITGAISIGLWKSRDPDADQDGDVDASDYFLAGRGLTWWLVGFSLIAANISTEQFVGMSGKAADWLGMAIASYEWMAAVTLVVVAFVFLPKFLKSGIYTIPEFLGYRYGPVARTLMAVFSLLVLVGVPTVTVIFSGAKVMVTNFQGFPLMGQIVPACWIIGLVGAGYVFVGGLKACAWTDLILGAALVLGGCVIANAAFTMLAEADPQQLIETSKNPDLTVEQLADSGAWERFWSLNDAPVPKDTEPAKSGGKLHMVRPLHDPEIPWSALLLGLWIPNFFYWGLNQFITQRTLGSKSLAEGQKGIVFAAFLKLIIPFVVVIPGILAYNLFNENLRSDAINRNAGLIAAKSPDFYRSLPDTVKPVANEENEPLLAKIAKSLEKEQGDVTTLYKFDDKYAALYPEIAMQVLEYNRDSLGGDFATPDIAGDAEPKDLAAASSAVEGVGKNTELAERFGVETLVDHDYDNAFPTLIRELLPQGSGLKGFVLAAMFGAVISSLASMLNSASTIATMDLYAKFAPNASSRGLVGVGRFFVVLFVLIAAYLAPMLANPEFQGIFSYVQEFQGFLSPGTLAVFIFGLLVHRAPRSCGTVGLLLGPALFAVFKFGADWPVVSSLPGIATVTAWPFLDRMALTFGLVLATLGVMTLVKPLPAPVELPVNEKMDITSSSGAKLGGVLVCVLTAVLYYVFW